MTQIYEQSATRYSSAFLCAITTIFAVVSVLLLRPADASGLTYALNFRNPAPGDLEVVRVSGASMYRAELDFTCTSGGADWAPFDALVTVAWTRGITILPVLVRSYPACGAAEHKRYMNSGDGHWHAWAAWARAAVERYGPNGDFWIGKSNRTPIVAWQVGNEPNLAENNPGGQYVQPAAYGAFLTHTAAAVQAGALAKTAQHTQVVTAGLYGAGGHFYGSFLQEMGATSAYTAVAIHPYSFFNGAQGVAETINNLRAILNTAVPGGAGKPIWITELGWPVGGYAGLPAGAAPVSEQKQAEFLDQSFAWVQANAASKNIHLVTWYKIQDQSVTGSHWSEFTGLRRFDGSFRPAWYAFRARTGAPPASWHAPYNLGGVIEGDPDVASWGWGRLDIFARGANGLLHTKYFDGTYWHGWFSIPGPAITSGPGAVAWGPNRIDVVARAADGSVVHWWYQGSQWNSESLGGAIIGSPDISSWAPGRLDIFARGVDGTLHHKWFDNNTWSQWESLGGNLTSGPGAVSWGPHRIDVVGRAGDGSVAHWWFDGASWHSGNLGGEILDAPDIASWAPGRLDVFARGANNALHHKWFQGAWYPAWDNKGGVELTSGPGAVSWDFERIDIFGRGPGGDAYQWWFGW